MSALGNTVSGCFTHWGGKVLSTQWFHHLIVQLKSLTQQQFYGRGICEKSPVSHKRLPMCTWGGKVAMHRLCHPQNKDMSQYMLSCLLNLQTYQQDGWQKDSKHMQRQRICCLDKARRRPAIAVIKDLRPRQDQRKTVICPCVWPIRHMVIFD